MTFETLPVVHLDEGRFPEYPGQDPERVLTDLARRFGRVVVTDVAGVRKNDADLEFIQHAARRRALWADAGSRYADDAMDLFIAGAEAVTMRWNTLDRPDELEEAVEVCQPGTLFLALEFPRGAFLQHPRDKRDAAQVVTLAEELGLGLVMVIDDAREDALRALPLSRTPRYVQGPVSVAAAQSMGFAGAMLAPLALPKEASG
ncbi:MAG TPA: hypothetical protein VFH78_11330 [Candidatus Thermoplasmatota archaeon]|nr:hypothetical protein [Candidatus Thermoplasmatota archaeon]